MRVHGDVLLGFLIQLYLQIGMGQSSLVKVFPPARDASRSSIHGSGYTSSLAALFTVN